MKTASFLAAFVLSLGLFAGNPHKDTAAKALISSQIQLDGDKLFLELNNPLQKDLSIKVYSSTGVLIMKHSLNKVTTYNGQYNFTDLADGQYSFQLFMDDVLIDEAELNRS